MLRRMILTALLMASLCAAQSITGTVYDPTAAVVPNARVILMQDYSKLQETRSGENGGFAFTGLSPGMYQVQIKQGMFSLFQNTVILKGTETVRVYAVLPLARSSDEIAIDGRLAPGAKRALLADQAKRRGGRIQPAALADFQPPRYPEAAQSAGIDGPVVLYASIKTDGTVGGVVVIESPHYLLEDEALAAVRKWRYRPMTLNAQPVESQVVIVLNFRLQPR